ncbi:MAG: hypothetical protein ACHQFX_04955 [Chitinophagales bacterium]
MKICFLVLFSLAISQVIAQQRLRDSLYGGRLKADTGKTFVSKDTSKYVVLKNENVSVQPNPGTKTAASTVAIIKPDESMPDSLNKLFYSKQKLWKRFIESNTLIISQQADDTRKVKKGTYEIEVDYEIGVNGRVSTKGITCNPPNEYLTEQVTELMKRPPVLSPPIYSDGKPRVLAAKQPITIVKK